MSSVQDGGVVDDTIESPSGSVAVLGEALIDLVPTTPATFAAAPGGSPANVAVGLARLGVPTRALARLSGDHFGTLLRERFARDAVDLSAVVDAHEPSSLAVVQRAADGSATYDLRIDGTADWQWTDGELDDALGPDVVGLHVGSLAAVMPPGAAAVQRLVRRARTQATISYDPNCRARVMEPIFEVRQCIEDLLALADLVKISDEDLAWLYPGLAAEQFVTRLIGSGAAFAAVTRGRAGAVVGSPEIGLAELPAQSVQVVDTVGAGDSYMSAVLAGFHRAGLLGAHQRGRLLAADRGLVLAVADEAARAAAITCGRQGADPPTLADLGARPQAAV